MLPDTMDAANNSFFLDATSDEAAQSLAGGREDTPKSRDSTPTELPSADTNTGLSNAVAESKQTPDRAQEYDIPPQAMLIFIMGEHRFSDSCELGVLNEHPEALKAITSNQCLSTSAFLKPALEAAMAELRPLMMMPVAIRLTAISLRLIAGILPNHQPSPQDENAGEGEQQKLAETVRHELGQAVPYYQWQGPTNYCGRIQYLMALLEEAIRVMAVPRDSLTEALKLDTAAAHISQRVLQSILDLGQNPKEVCGAWAADTLLLAWVPRKAYQPPRCLTLDFSKMKENGVELATSPDFDSDDELPSPSEFVRRKPDTKAARALPLVEVRAPNAADDHVFRSGSAGRVILVRSASLQTLTILYRRSAIHLRFRPRRPASSRAPY